LRTLYTWLLYAALPWILLRLWWRGRREPGYRDAIAERFGYAALDAKPKLLWLHAVSVGEVRACAPLVRGLQREHPDHDVLVTCLTAAGRDTVKQVFGESVLQAYLPYDYPGAARRFLQHYRPRLGVLVETEIWPNLMRACEAHGVPVMLANARMSRKSAQTYQRLSWLSRPAFARLAAVCAQGESDARRLSRLGAPNVAVTGNLKFDIEPDAAKAEEGKSFRAALRHRKVLLFASTREGEEERHGGEGALAAGEHVQGAHPLARRLGDDIDAGEGLFVGLGEHQLGLAAAEERLEVALELAVDLLEGGGEALLDDALQLLDGFPERGLCLPQVGELAGQEVVALAVLGVVGFGLLVDGAQVPDLGA